MDCVIIGGGIAGIQAALTFRRQWPNKTVTLVDTEKEIGYYRTLLPQFMNRSLPEKKLFFWRAQEDPQLKVVSGVRVESVERNNRTVLLSNRERIHYNRLLIASGGRPIVPALCRSAGGNGIFPIRSLAVARTARAWLPDHPEVFILGGGLVGVKTAAHLAGYNVPVTLIEKEVQLLPQALSAEASRLVEIRLRQQNIRLLLGSTVEDMRLDRGALSGIKANGRWFSCQTLLVAAGSIPEVGFLADSGLLRDGRLEVSSSLQTGDGAIFAAGDAVTIVDDGSHTPWTWPQAAVQGKLAAANLYGSLTSSLRCLSRVNSMDLNGYPLSVIGIPVAGAARSVYSRPATSIYRELFHVGGRIVGGALLGDISNNGRLHAMMNSGEPVETDLDDLVKPRTGTFSRMSPSCVNYYRRATMLSPEGV